jgi:predicted RND superfamily exporter protein
MPATADPLEMPVVPDPAQFDARSGIALERLIFNHRTAVLLLCALLTMLLGMRATRLTVNTSLQDMMPRSHPYVRNMLAHEAQLRGLGNALRVVVQHTRGDIYDRDFLNVVRQVNDRLYLLPGIDRSTMRGLWTASLRWTEVTEEGYLGGPVMPDGWDGSPAAMAALRANVARAGLVGSFVADDQRSTLILAPLLDTVQETGRPLDYGVLSRALEAQLRSLETEHIKVRMVGFAKIAGDLIEGLGQVARYFAFSVAIATLLVFAATRCWRSTLLLLGCALLGVVWLLGIMQWLGYTLDPYTILVPFLVFAIGLSHGAQKMNGILLDVGRGTHRSVAARYTFRRLFVPGLTALLANVVGFAVLGTIDIPVMRAMAITASLGVAVLIVTKLLLVPVLLSVVGVSPAAARRALARSRGRRGHGLWRLLPRLTERRWAIATLVATALLVAAAAGLRSGLQVGDLDPGAPELRAGSRYNLDAAYLAAHYGLSSDPFVVMLHTPPGGCASFEALVEADRLGAALRELEGVRSTASAAEAARMALAGQFEGNPKWLAISRNPSLRGAAIEQVRTERPELIDAACTLLPVVAYLADHKAQTLARVVQASESFAAAHGSSERRYLLAAGSAGVEAATNMVVAQSLWRLHVLLFAAVALLCFITFRSWRAVLVALVPLAIGSLLCEALMVLLGIGLKVATLPVIAVGVGVGVDYALYLLGIQLMLQRRGLPLREAYGQALRFTGQVVALVGLTLAAGVLPWALSPIRFQADMGLLLAFMLLWNVGGALVLVPALSHLLAGRIAAPERA